MRGNKSYQEIKKFLEEFPNKKVNGESINDIRYDGWPIWWFFKVRFMGNRLLSPLPSHQQIIASIKNGKKIGVKEKIKNKLTVFVLRKFVEYNEKSKLWISRFNKKRSFPTAKKKRIMFMAHTNGIIPDKDYGFTVDRIGTVVKEVRKDPQLEEYISIISPLTHKSSLKILDYPNLVYSYIDKEIKRKAKKHSSLLHKKWEKISAKIDYNLIGKHFKPALNFFFSREIIYLIILYYEAYKKIIQQEKINFLCFYAAEGILSKCAIAAAHKSRVKSLTISHGLGVPSRNPDQPSSFYHAVMGDKYKEIYVTTGVDPKNIFVVGPVFMDEIVPYIKEKYSNRKIKNILLATTPWLEDNCGKKETYVNYISKFLREMNKLDNIEIVLKLHPREKTAKLYKSIIDSQGYQNVKIIGGQGKDQLKSRLYNLINESEIIMSFGSTVSIEAMIIGKPSLIIDLIPNCNYGLILENRKKIPHVNPTDDISKIVGNILNNLKLQKEIINNQKEIIKEYLYTVDGKAGKRVLGVIKELINS